MKKYLDLDRTKSLLRLIPNLFDQCSKSVLYIGARTDRFDYGEEFRNAGYEIILLEVWPENTLYLSRIPWLKKVIQADITLYNFSQDDKFDIVFWWHGPEHIEETKIPITLKRLESVTNEYIILGCPWGKFEQGELYNNPFEKHISYLDYNIFEDLGYETECLGEKNLYGSNITAVKHMIKKTKE